MILDDSPYVVKFCETDQERSALYHLRWRVFVAEMGAKVSPELNEAQLEYDKYDATSTHLILIDKHQSDPQKNVVGAYRLITQENAAAGHGFYSATEFDIAPLLASGKTCLELGRNCIDPLHRGGVTLHLLWSALRAFVEENKIDVLFGAASFRGTDPIKFAHAIAQLHHSYQAPSSLTTRALDANFLDMNILARNEIDRKRAMQQMPSIIKSYLRLGGFVGQGAWVDHDFNTIDVCMILDTKKAVPTPSRTARGV